MRPHWTLPLFLIGLCAWAQDPGRSPYLIPPIVYVGDPATLVVPLAGGANGGAAGDAVITLDPQNLPFSPDLEIRRIALERRPSGSRLLVEFSAFMPGLLELPPVEIGGQRFAGLHVEISSVIGSGENSMVLSGPASSLAIPGTGLLVYGTMGVFTALLLLILWGVFWGRRHLDGWILKWKRGRLIVSMWGIEKRLRRIVLRDGTQREILNTLSTEFRIFLSFFTGKNCRAMTAFELGRLPSLVQNEAADTGRAEAGEADLLTGGFLMSFFQRCDALRFSGAEIITGDVLAMLGDLRRFLKTLNRAERSAAGKRTIAAVR
jgi:hypothetical protein